MGFSAPHCRLCCSSHTLNLVGQTLLWGKEANAFNNDASKLAEESEFMTE
jgi:hypothetical protein